MQADAAMAKPSPGATTCDSVLGGRLTLTQPKAGHRVGHDAVLLAAAAPAGARGMVDLGAGVGAAGLSFLARCPQALGVLVEIDPALAELARANAQANGMAGRCRAVAADVLALGRRAGPAEVAAGAADLVLMNPPYNARAAHNVSPQSGRALAHDAGEGLLEDWIKSAHRCLAPGGTLCLIHRPQALEEILAALSGRFGAAELIPLFPAPGAPAGRLIVRALKGRRTPPALLPGLVLAGADGAPSPAAEAILRAAQPLA
ncbi:methyltransferase [Xanthobacter tagetidis]|uniref:Methyltransferase n=2 Tax=Xanthobacter tagetidis TaxID=60216 RepID=A0A3L7AMV6_9HYPH|nr:methyltransferase [Xanthobacter tagetidis]